MTELEKKCELLAIECAKPLNLEILDFDNIQTYHSYKLHFEF